MNLISDQISEGEIRTIVRELSSVIGNKIDGDVVEFGCYLGTTSIHISKQLGIHSLRKFYVYDSFEGLPDKSDKDQSALGVNFKAGELLATKKQFIRNLNAAKVRLPIIKKGWFNELAGDDIPDKICFAFLDGDYYESIKTSIELIQNRLMDGSVVVVHDYSNPALPGSARAVDEWLRSKGFHLKKEHSLAIIKIQ